MSVLARFRCHPPTCLSVSSRTPGKEGVESTLTTGAVLGSLEALNKGISESRCEDHGIK